MVDCCGAIYDDSVRIQLQAFVILSLYTERREVYALLNQKLPPHKSTSVSSFTNFPYVLDSMQERLHKHRERNYNNPNWERNTENGNVCERNVFLGVLTENADSVVCVKALNTHFMYSCWCSSHNKYYNLLHKHIHTGEFPFSLPFNTPTFT